MFPIKNLEVKMHFNSSPVVESLQANKNQTKHKRFQINNMYRLPLYHHELRKETGLRFLETNLALLTSTRLYSRICSFHGKILSHMCQIIIGRMLMGICDSQGLQVEEPARPIALPHLINELKRWLGLLHDKLRDLPASLAGAVLRVEGTR